MRAVATRNTRKYDMTNVDVVVTTRESGAQAKFSAEKYQIELIESFDCLGGKISQELRVAAECAHSHTLVLIEPGTTVPQPAPKYNAAMGDAAQEYVDRVVDTDPAEFRWEEVWKIMWAAHQK